MAFLRNLLATVVGLFVFFFLLMALVAGIASTASQDEVPDVKENSVLWLKLSGALQERAPEESFNDFFPGATPRVIGLDVLLRAIESAKEDDRISGIYMEHMYLSASYAMLSEIRQALAEFRKSGKFIYAYGEFISESDFFLASVADKLYLNPLGNLEFNGLAANVTFYKGLFDKLEIEPEIFRVGSYKSAIEPFIRKDLSTENREQLKELVLSINNTYLEEVANSLSVEKDQLREIQNKMLGQTPDELADLKLVTATAYEDQIKEEIMWEVDEEEVGDINFISFRNYEKAVEKEYSKNKIAIIVGEGEIVMGGEPSENIIGEKFAREIRKARESKSVKAIILRINSPGGSITASDMIWREVQKTKGVKPILASMSGVAASGGYYMAMACDTIVASPATITGSIGIFSMLFNLQDFLDNKLGITSDGVSSGDYSDIFTVMRPLNEQEKAIIQKGVNRGYETFINKAAQGRNMSKEEMEALAQGRVWTGEQAKANGLVDVMGGLKETVELAAAAADIEDDFRVSYYPRQKPFFETIIERFGEEARSVVWSSPAYQQLKTLEDIQKFTKMSGLQARMLMDLEIN